VGKYVALMEQASHRREALSSLGSRWKPWMDDELRVNRCFFEFFWQ
jgi:hypothetical protein